MVYKTLDMKEFKLINYTKSAELFDMLFAWIRNYNLEVKFLNSIFYSHDIQINSVLDIGCGTGNHIFHLQSRDYRTVGIDISSEMLSEALSKNRKSENISLMQGDILNPPLREECFDASYAFYCLVHNFYPVDILKRFFFNIKKMLRPNGLFVLDALNIENYRIKYPKTKLYHLGKHTWEVFTIDTYLYPYFDKKSLLHMNLFHSIRDDSKRELQLRTEHVYCMYDVQELTLAAIENSLEPVKVYGDFNFSPFDKQESEFAIIVFQVNEAI